MDLQREFFGGIENLSRAKGSDPFFARRCAEQFRSVMFHEPAEILAGERAIGDDAGITPDDRKFPTIRRWQRRRVVPSCRGCSSLRPPQTRSLKMGLKVNGLKASWNHGFQKAALENITPAAAHAAAVCFLGENGRAHGNRSYRCLSRSAEDNFCRPVNCATRTFFQSGGPWSWDHCARPPSGFPDDFRPRGQVSSSWPAGDFEGLGRLSRPPCDLSKEWPAQPSGLMTEVIGILKDQDAVRHANSPMRPP